MAATLGTVIGIVGATLLVGAPLWWLLMRKVDHDGAEAGGSLGNQFLFGRKERLYEATISVAGRPPEIVRAHYSSQGDAKRRLRSMYGRRCVSDVHAVEE
jgi:hypothetical protein